MANKKITDLMSGTPVRDSLLESAIDISGTMDSRKVKAGAVADLASANVAAPYDTTVTYAIGQYCLYEGDIYRCIAITTGAFDSTKWTQIVVTGEFRRVVELTSAQYTALSSAEKNNGTLYILTDEETTAADIPYSAGVSVADKLDSLNNDLTITKIPISDFIQVASGVSIDGRSAIYKQGKHIWFNIYGSITGTFTPNTAKSIGTVKSGYITENLITTICGIHDSMWGVSNIGYLFFNTDGSMQVATAASNMNNFKISLDFCTA